MKTWIGIGASFVVAAMLGVLHYTDANAVLQFVVAIIALALLAWTVGVGTETVGVSLRRRPRPACSSRRSAICRSSSSSSSRCEQARSSSRRPRSSARCSRTRSSILGLAIIAGRVPVGRRRHALPHAPAERHDDAADARRLHDRDHLDLDLARRQGVGQRGDDLGHRCDSDPLRLRRLARELPESRRAAGAGDRGGACARDELSARASSSSRSQGSQPPSRPSGSSR